MRHDQRMGRVRVSLAVFSCVVGCACGAHGSASTGLAAAGARTVPKPVTAAVFDGSTWSIPTRSVARTSSSAQSGAEYFPISCPSSGVCFAVGSVSRHYDGHTSQSLVARLGAGVWSAQSLPGAVDQPRNLSCAGDRLCVAVGSTATYVWAGTAWRLGPVFPGNASRTVACAAPDSCVELQPTTYRYEELHAGTWTAPRQISPLSGTNVLPDLLSCATTTFCLGLSDLGAYWTFDGAQWSPGIRIGFPLRVGFDPKALSCSGPQFCVAVGGDVQGRPLASLYNGRGWSTPTAVVTRAGWSQLTSVSCPTTAWCAAIGTSATKPSQEFVVTLDRTRWSATTTIDDVEGDPSVSCATVTYCVALTGEVQQ